MSKKATESKISKIKKRVPQNTKKVSDLKSEKKLKKMAATSVKPAMEKIEVEKITSVESSEVKSGEKKKDYLYAVGRRKTAIAQVRIYKKGSGKITINNKPFNKYFSLNEQEIVKFPLKLIGQLEKLDVTVKVLGGGLHSQAEAIRHGIARALIQLNPNFRKPLKKAGFITRDAREKERKKPGLKRARRAPQWQKR